ncbi:MAG TPA: hypothetical protein VFY38_10870, partial [Pseudonocardia sp.]|nr:hypothetical protein [Pseudonocardia sp.]
MREIGQLRIDEHPAEAVDGPHDERVDAPGVVTDGRDAVADLPPDDARPEPPVDADGESEPVDDRRGGDAPRPVVPAQRRRPSDEQLFVATEDLDRPPAPEAEVESVPGWLGGATVATAPAAPPQEPDAAQEPDDPQEPDAADPSASAEAPPVPAAPAHAEPAGPPDTAGLSREPD